MQLPEGEFAKGFVQDMLKQLGTDSSSLPQKIVQLGMQGMGYSSSMEALTCLMFQASEQPCVTGRDVVGLSPEPTVHKICSTAFLSDR